MPMGFGARLLRISDPTGIRHEANERSGTGAADTKFQCDPRMISSSSPGHVQNATNVRSSYSQGGSGQDAHARRDCRWVYSKPFDPKRIGTREAPHTSRSISIKSFASSAREPTRSGKDRPGGQRPKKISAQSGGRGRPLRRLRSGGEIPGARGGPKPRRPLRGGLCGGLRARSRLPSHPIKIFGTDFRARC